ncbi:hypothetical protein EGW08_010164 [Elysia chlorotica]|uniref:SAM domain-containing protein n=1 Tax=Elysia chlorotica TaxID=188477 RepID=A0A433TKG3_ELYCH|nr:hypothetical protein EGW08_010164 [Elysia chlorotica]
MKVLTLDDLHRIQVSGIPKACMIELLRTLHSRPPEREAYKFLLEALRKSNTEWLAEAIETTPADGDPTVRAKCDPSLAEDKLRVVLISNFCTRKGSKIPISEIQSILDEKQVFQGMDKWSPKEIVDFTCSTFGVTSETKNERRKMKTKKIVYIKNICKQDLPIANFENPSPTIPHSTDDEKPRNVSNMTCQELRHYLTTRLEAEGMVCKLLDDLEANDISGSVFLTLTEKDLKEFLPSATFGMRRKLSMIIQDLSNPPPILSERQVRLRKFDKEVNYMDKYQLGRCCDTSTSVKGNTKYPHRVFNLIDPGDSEEENLEFIGSAVVQFASACINERRDGTVYFGISPDTSGPYRQGEIVGIELSKEDIESTMRRYLAKSFDSQYRSLIKDTVRDAKFVQVIGMQENARSLLVVEVDIRPLDAVLQYDKIITRHSEPGFSGKGIYGFSENGLPKILDVEEICHLEKNISHAPSPKRKESLFPPTNLRAKLLNLLTGGCDVMQDNVYPFLMLSPLAHEMDQGYLSENMLFVNGLKPELVLDFDPTGSSNGIYANLNQTQDDSMQVLIPDNFDKEEDLEKGNSFKDSLKDLTGTAWMFCNGYQEMSIRPASCYEWKKNNKEGFRKALQFFIDSFGVDRIILIVCLYSEEYEVMLHACDEAISQLRNSWILLAESEEVARRWSENMLERFTVEQNDLHDRCVLGLSWCEVNSTLLQAAQITAPQTYVLPTSKGAHVEVPRKKLKDWCDLDILTAGDLLVDIEKSSHIRKEVEQKFYQGEQAQWLNFWFEDQVLKRDVHHHLKQRVEEALNGTHKDEENMVTVVPILHQPMAGGTTSARQILWELRKKHRCCLVLNISDTTLDQLEEVRSFRDSTPLPLLILIDNEDEEKYIQLRGRLEAKGRKLWRGADFDDPNKVYCTIILCLRSSSLPKEIKKDQTVLRQELTQRELEWFRHKGEQLTQVYTKDNKSNVNPKFLISFNILKENFNTYYITRVVKEFTDDVHETSELELLKFISFLNTFDPYFKSVKVSALDNLIVKTNSSSATVLSQGGRRQLQWEAQLSQSVKVLLNLSTNREQHKKPRTYIRVFNKIIAENILDNMKARLGQQESLIMQQILKSGVFQHAEDMFDKREMRTLINNIVKKREMQPDGKKRYRFSKFVLQVEKIEGADAAAAILEAIFDENEDAFTAQLVSRYYINLKNWSKAEQFAKRATDLNPFSSFLWDTYGQVFKEQILELSKNEDSQLSPEDLHTVIEISRKCIDTFQREQRVSEQEVLSSGDINLAGYFGEVRTLEMLLRALNRAPCFSNPDEIREFLIGKLTNINAKKVFSEDDTEYLRDQYKSSGKAMRRLDDEFLQIKDTSNYDVTLLPWDNNKSDLINLKVSLHKLLGLSNIQIPKNIPEALHYKYRYALISAYGGISLNHVLNLRSEGKETEIRQICHLAMDNMKQKSCSFNDLRTVLDAATVLLAEKKLPHNLTYKNLLEWSKQLLYMKPQEEGYHYLEPYLYFTMYNFPTADRNKEKLCPIIDLKRTIGEWFEAFTKKYPKPKKDDLAHSRKVKTLFFLANGPPLSDIIHQDSLDEMNGTSREDKWQLPGVREKLRLMKGMLLQHGDKIRMQIQNSEGNSFEVDIATSHHVRKKEMWQKQVYFYLGFSFSGPKAFGMSLE